MKKISGKDRDKAMSVVIGVVLMVAIGVAVWTMAQASVVPAQEKEIELDHYDRSVGDLQNMRSSIINVETDDKKSIPVKLGVNYPSSKIFIHSP